MNTILKNSLTGFLSQISYIVFTFLTRTVLLRTLGVEILGLNSTFSSIVSTLSLVELGFQTAIVYSFYKPLFEHNYNRVNDLLNLFRRVYFVIGVVFIAGSLLAAPLLKYILKGIEMTVSIYAYYTMHCSTTAVAFFLGYRRALVYADRKDYIIKTVDTTLNIACNIFCIISLILLKSYLCYLFIKMVQVIVSNLIINCKARKMYPFLRKNSNNRWLLLNIIGNVKDIFAGKVAYYIYASTDSLILSAAIGTKSVGYYANYLTITNSVKMVTDAILQPLIPTIGNFCASGQDVKRELKLFQSFNLARYILSLIFVIPTAVLTQDFISIWVGAEYIISHSVILLFCADLYIHIVHSVTCDFISVYGYFKSDKYIEITGAILNIVISLLLVHSLGIAGVLLGTVLCQVFFWIGRSALIYKNRFGFNANFRKYCMTNIAYLIGFCAVLVLCWLIYEQILSAISFLPLRLITGGITCEIIASFFVLLFLKNSDGFKMLKSKIIKSMKAA